MQRSWFLALPAHFKSPEDLIKITETSPTSRNSNSFGLQMSCASVLKTIRDFPSGPVIKTLPCSGGDTGSI